MPETYVITGGAGFIGSHIAERLLRDGHTVRIVDNFATGKRENLAVLPPGCELFEVSITSKAALDEAFAGADYVLHQAALPSVPRSIDDPLTTHEYNVTGTLNVLLAARDAGVKRVAYAASSSAYGDIEGEYKDETMAPRPLSPYGVSKLAGEYYAQAFTAVYGLETVALRYFNVFGPRQDANGAYAAVVPKWTSAMIHNEPVFINGDGETSRDFCYIANTVQANLLAATAQHPDAANQVYNVAVGDRTTLNDLFEAIRASLEPRFQHLKDFKPTYRDFRAGDVRHSLADISKARNLLGYEPSHRIKEGLVEAMDWYVSDLTK